MKFKDIVDYVEENKSEYLGKELTTNREKLRKIAEQNTKRNQEGLTVITKDDVWREE